MQLNSAMKCAVRAHRGQVDKCGKDYISHPSRVAAMVKPLGEDFEIVAWLHDVLEDTDYFDVDMGSDFACATDLQMKYGFSSLQALGLVGITRFEWETYNEYVEQIPKSFIARVVKIADLRDNLSPERLDQLPERQRRGLSDRYLKSLDYLTRC